MWAAVIENAPAHCGVATEICRDVVLGKRPKEAAAHTPMVGHDTFIMRAMVGYDTCYTVWQSAPVKGRDCSISAGVLQSL